MENWKVLAFREKERRMGAGGSEERSEKIGEMST